MGQAAVESWGLGKRYVLGENTSRQRLAQALSAMLPGSSAHDQPEVWALREASFKIAPGEAVGIIGRNGAGKSTLLKILSRVTRPTEGHARVNGRVGTLLEVGTGFHPELTGRDNIFLSGMILGMRHQHVKKQFDEIVAFSGVEKFVDTPVKRYSSGMYVRLAFSVASFLEPEILIVDEVLAVGDAAFQKKSLGRLNEASTNQGRTVLFVSHNLQAIRTFCRRVLLLDAGRVVFDGPAEEGIAQYLHSMPKSVDLRALKMEDRLNRTTGDVRFTSVSCVNEIGQATWTIRSGESPTLRFAFETLRDVPDLALLFRIRSALNNESLTTLRQTISAKPLRPSQKGFVELRFPDLPLRPGELSLYAVLGSIDRHVSYDVIDDNVDLPFLRIASDCTDQFARDGVVSLPHQARVVLT